MSTPPAPAGGDAWTEVRFSLRELLAEVAEEHASGAMSTEKLHQKEIRKIFHPPPADSRDRP